MEVLRLRVTVADGETDGYAPLTAISGRILRIEYDEPTLASGTAFDVEIYNGVPGATNVIVMDDKTTNSNTAAGKIEYSEGIANTEGFPLCSFMHNRPYYINIEQGTTQDNSGADAVYDLYITWERTGAGWR